MAEYQSPFVPGLPRFTGGAVGYLGYEAAAWFEPTTARPDGARRPGDDAAFMLFDTVLAFDHVQHRILVIANARISGDEDLRVALPVRVREDRVRRARARAAAVGADDPRGRPAGPVVEPDAGAIRGGGAQGQGAHRGRRHLPGGAVAAVRGRDRRRPFTVYRALRHVNPSPYMFFVRVRTAQHRRLVARDAGARRGPPRRDASDCRHPPARPHARRGSAARRRAEAQREGARRARDAGRPRPQRHRPGERLRHGAGADLHEPRALLARDAPGLGGRGQLADGRDRLDALAACFPAGTVSGAPKMRAMQIIDELEPGPRGVYGGAVGYLDFAGNLDFCIAIRTIVLEQRHGLRAGRAPASSPTRIRPPSTTRRATRRGRCCAPSSWRGRDCSAMVLVIDNYDSFTFNLVQYLGELGAEIAGAAQRRGRRRRRCGRWRPIASSSRRGRAGPRTPACRCELIRQLASEVPILGVCLGHQAIGHAFGGARGGGAGAAARQDVVGRPRRPRHLPGPRRRRSRPAATTRSSSPPTRGPTRSRSRRGRRRRRGHGAAPPRASRSTACSSIPSRS